MNSNTHKMFEEKIKPKLISSLILVIMIFIAWVIIDGNKSYPKALYRTGDITEIHIRIDTTRIQIRTQPEIGEFTRTMLKSKTKLRSDHSKIMWNQVAVEYYLKDGGYHYYPLGNLGKDGNAIMVGFHFYRGDSLLALIDKKYYRFPEGTRGLELFRK